MQAIVALGRALDLTLLAEGVETEEQRVLLRLAGCEEMQGLPVRPPGAAARRSTGCWPRPAAAVVGAAVALTACVLRSIIAVAASQERA